jgi:hypothetical protein
MLKRASQIAAVRPAEPPPQIRTWTFSDSIDRVFDEIVNLAKDSGVLYVGDDVVGSGQFGGGKCKEWGLSPGPRQMPAFHGWGISSETSDGSHLVGQWYPIPFPFHLTNLVRFRLLLS